MPIPIKMPRLSDTMQEGTLIKWRVKVGDKVKADDVIADVETDKATMELQPYEEGTVAKLLIDEGQSAPLGQTIMMLADKGESIEDAAKAAPAVSSGGAAPAKKDSPRGEAKPAGERRAPPGARPGDEASESDEEETSAPSGAPGGGRVRVSPLARKIAEEKGVDLSKVKGSGPDGRIVKRDVQDAATPGGGSDAKPQAIPQGPGREAQGPEVKRPATGAATGGSEKKSGGAPLPPPAQLQARVVPVSNMRRTIATRLVESKTTIPHFTVTISINMDPVLSLRQTINQQLESQGVKLSVNDFVVRAAALAILRFPYVNSSWTDQGIRQYDAVHVGIAVALSEEKGGGLVVPVLRDADKKGLRAISQETRQLAEKARTRGLTVQEMDGGTFTISNLGMFGVDHFEAIINPPQAAILAVGAALEKPVARNAQIVVGNEMAATLSADHRVVDGAMAAQFLAVFKQLLEAPAALLV